MNILAITGTPQTYVFTADSFDDIDGETVTYVLTDEVQNKIVLSADVVANTVSYYNTIEISDTSALDNRVFFMVEIFNSSLDLLHRGKIFTLNPGDEVIPRDYKTPNSNNDFITI